MQWFNEYFIPSFVFSINESEALLPELLKPLLNFSMSNNGSTFGRWFSRLVRFFILFVSKQLRAAMSRCMNLFSFKYSQPRAISSANTIRSPMLRTQFRCDVPRFSRRNVFKSPPIKLMQQKTKMKLECNCLVQSESGFRRDDESSTW